MTQPDARPPEVFAWHPLARLFDATEVEYSAPQLTMPPRVLADQPSASALMAAMAGPFRIGGDAPLSAGPGQFETLTAGSSGKPRSVLRGMASWIASFRVNAGLFDIGPGADVAVLGRLVHSLALYASIEALHLGANLHLLDVLRPDHQLKALATRQITHLYATPAQLRQLTEPGTTTLPALRHLIIGGSKLDDLLRAALTKMAPNAGIFEFYGAAESSFITISDDSTPAGSVGRAYPGVRIEVRRDEALDGQIGQIWTNSPYAFLRYGDGAAHSGGGAVWQDGWLSVGEMGWTAQGYLYLAGRAGRMVNVADQNVFPEDIEAWLLTYPSVRRAAVLAEPDARRGSVLIAVLMGDPHEADAILRAARLHFGPLKAPRRVIWRADWPELPSGKTDLQLLATDLS